MRKSIAFICVILVLLFMAYSFTYKENGYLSQEAYVINDISVIRNMMSGTTEPGTIQELVKIDEGVPLYTRGNSLYFGEDKVKIQTVAPYFVKDGSTLLLHDNSAKLIGADFSLSDTYQDMYVTRGHSFNNNGQAADEEEFLLLGLSSGAFLNVQDMKIVYPAGTFTIPANSILCIKNDVLRFYRLEADSMNYNCFTDVFQAYVTIGSCTMRYQDFFKSLFDVAKTYLPSKAIEEIEEEKKDTEKTLLDDSTPENTQQNEKGENAVDEHEQKAVDRQTPFEGRNIEASSENKSQTIPNQQIGERKTADSSLGESGKENTESGAGTTLDAPETDLSQPAVYIKPQISIANVRASVYTVSMDVSINDPDNKLTKGAKIIIYKDDKIYMRKTISVSGKLVMGALAPGSHYELAGEFDYRNETENKDTEVFQEKIPFQTLELSTLPAIRISYTIPDELFAHQMKLTNFSAVVAPSINTPTDTVTDYISKMVIKLEKGGQTTSLELSNEEISKIKTGQQITFQSTEVLASNSNYSMEVLIFDRFGNELLSENASPSMSTTIRTCKQAPSAIVSLVSNAVGALKIGVTLTDQDHTQLQNVRLYFYDSEGNAAPLLLQGEESTRNFIDIDEHTLENKQVFTISNLPSNMQFQAAVYCDYKSGASENYDRENSSIGNTTFFTSPLSVLGCVYFTTSVHDATADSVIIRASIKQTTNNILLSLLDTIKFRLRCDRNQHEYLLTKAQLYSITVTEGVAFEEILYEGNEITIKATGTAAPQETTIWDCLLHGNAVLEYTFEEGNSSVLLSSTNYLGYFDCSVDQGGMKQDISNPYTNVSFKTLRKKPVLEYRGSIAANDFFDIYDLCINDPDECIADGIVYARLKNKVTGKVVDMQNISTNVKMDKLGFSSLEAETEYTVEFICKQYNEGFSVASVKEQYILPQKFDFTTGFNLSGEISLNSLEYGDKQQGVLFGPNIFTADNATPEVRFVSTTGANDNTTANSAYSITDYIPVNAGEHYRMSKFFSLTSTSSTRMTCHFYKKDTTTGQYVLLSGNKGCIFCMQEGLINVPASAEYMRVEYNSKYAGCASICQVYTNFSGGTNLVTSFQSTSYLNTNGTITTNASYKTSNLISVEEGAFYYRSTNKTSYGGVATRWVCFYNDKMQFLNWYAIDQNEALIQAPAKAAYMRTFQSNGETTNLTVVKISNGKGQSSENSCMIGESQVTIADKNRVLLYDEMYGKLTGHYYLSIYKNNVFKEKKTFSFDAGEANLITEIRKEDYQSLILDYNALYRVELSVVLLNGQEVVLDQIELTTQSNIKLLRNEYDIQSIAKDIYAKYRMANDINYTLSNVAATNFYGEFDGGGHTLIYNDPSSLFTTLKPGGKVCNLCVERTVPDNAAATKYFITYNYGTVCDLISKIYTNSANNKLKNAYYLAYVNYPEGVLERFAVLLDGDMYFNSSLVCLYNYGVIKDGYVNGGDFYVTSGVYGGMSVSKPCTGVIAAYNYGGALIENIYVAGDMYIEEGTSTVNCGIMVGYNRNGDIKNCFCVGDRYVYTVDEDNLFYPKINVTYGPCVGNSAGIYTNLCYISQYAYNPTVFIRTASYTLWDTNWYQGNLNSTRSFIVDDMVNMGYYPKLILKGDDMPQPSFELPPFEPVQNPKLISAVVTEQTENYADCILTFRNPQGYQVNDFSINGLSCVVDTGAEGQYFEGDSYRVKARVQNPTLFRSSYPITSTTFGFMGGSYTTYYGTAIGQEIPVNLNAEFWKPVASAEEWKSLSLDLYGNYRITDDIDFDNSAATDIVVRSAFRGRVDGGIYDEDGTLIGMHSLNNIYTGGYGYVFYQTYNTKISNLLINNMTSSQTPTYYGFIALAYSGTGIENVHMNKVRLYANSYSGGICSSLQSASITNCSVTDIQIIARKSKALYIGGITGYVSDSGSIENCYVSGLDIHVVNAAGNKGSGGICGYFTGTRIADCYAFGKITTNFGYVGGITGYTTSSYIQRCICDVDIDTMAGNVGGAIGSFASTDIRATQILSTGDIFTNSSNTDGIGRVFGTTQSATTAGKIFGYTGQLVAGNVLKGDITGVQANLDTQMLHDYKNYNGENSFLNVSEGTRGEVTEEEAGEGFEQSSEDSKKCGYYNLQDVEDGFFPRLYGTNGVLLPNQSLHVLPDDSVYITWDKDKSIAFSIDDYHAEFTVYHSNYHIKSINLEGMQLPADISPFITASGTTTYQIEGIRPLEFRDTFKLVVILEDDDRNQTTISSKVAFKHSNLSYDIRTAADWQTLMESHGANYENFNIHGTIDLTGITTENLVKNVRIGKLHGFENATIIVNNTGLESGDSLIADCAVECSNISFKDCVWSTTKADGSNFGLIGNLGGTADHLSFNNILIESYNSECAGCIGTLSGSLTNTTIHDVRHLYRSGSYKGGLTGKILPTGSINNLTITASNTGVVETDSFLSMDVLQANAWLKPSIPAYSSAYLGYIAGSSSGLVQNVTVSASDNAYIQVKGYYYLGGLIGSQGIINDSVNGVMRQAEVSNLYVVGGYCYIGGLIGYTTCKVVDASISDSIIYSGARTTGSYVGGIVGIYGGVLRCKVNRCIIGNPRKDSYVGGVLGNGYNIKNIDIEVKDTVVQGLYRVGGAVGQMYSVGSSYYYSNCRIENCTITSTGDCAGGIAGYGSQIKEDSYVKDCTIQALNYAGGIVGLTPYSNTAAYSVREVGVLNTSVTAENKYAGGIAGGYNLLSLYNSFTNQVNVKAKYYAGGLIGQADGGSYYNLAVYSSNTVTPVKVFAQVKYAGGIFGELLLSNRTYSTSLSVKQAYIIADVEAPDYTGGIAGSSAGSSDVDKNIKDEHLQGVLSCVRVKSTGPNLLISEASGLSGLHSGLLLGDNGEDHAQSNGVNADSILYYENVYAKLADNTKVTSEETDANGKLYKRSSAQIAMKASYTDTIETGGLGFIETAFSFDSLDESGAGVPSPYGYMPKIRNVTVKTSGIYDLLRNQDNWIPVPTFSDVALFSRRMFSMFKGATIEILPEMTVYASGADSINLEFDSTIPYDADRDTGATFAIYHNDICLLEEPITKRVYSLQYDYASALIVYVKNATESKVYEISPADFSESLWMEEDNYYYLNDYGIGSSKGQLIGNFVTLNKGYALTCDGKLYKLSDGSIIRDVTDIKLLTEERPLFETIITDTNNSNEFTVKAYYGFSVFENDEQTSISEGIRLFIKDGELQAIDPKLLLHPTSFVYERSGENVYSIALASDGSLWDMVGDTCKLPDNFRNNGIKECSYNLYSSLPYLFVRYEGGKLVAFNYQTGEIVATEATESDEDLISYAYRSMQADLAPKKTITGYHELVALSEQLIMNGIPEEYYAGSEEDPSTEEEDSDSLEDDTGEIETENDLSSEDEELSLSEGAEGTNEQDGTGISEGLPDETSLNFINPFVLYYDTSEETYKMIRTGSFLTPLMSGESGSHNVQVKELTLDYVTEEGIPVDKNGFNLKGEYIGEATTLSSFDALYSDEENHDHNVLITNDNVQLESDDDINNGIIVIVAILTVVGLLGAGIVVKFAKKR